jgi:hypothetical protein
MEGEYESDLFCKTRAFNTKGQSILGRKNPQKEAEHFQRAGAIWESNQASAATAYIQVYNCLTACAIQMTYEKEEQEKRNKWLEKEDYYTQQAYRKIFESTDPQDLLSVKLNQMIVQVRREQLWSKNGKIQPDQATRLLKQLQGVAKDIKLLCRYGYDAYSLLGKVEDWIGEISVGREALYYTK